MAQEYTVQTSDYVNVQVTSTLSSFASEKRFPKSLTIGTLKGRLELMTGCTAASMTIEVFTEHNETVCRLDNDDNLLGSYHIDDNMRLHVTDHGGSKPGEFQDSSAVEKFELSKDEYAKRTDTLRAYQMKNKLGIYSDGYEDKVKQKEIDNAKKAAEEEALGKSIKVNSRCKVSMQEKPTRLATVKYSGLTKFKDGYWIGVQYDEPHGKNDGSVGNERYFECPPKYGGFVKPGNIELGNFPEEDFDMEEI